jgi:hypothetical protein
MLYIQASGRGISVKLLNFADFIPCRWSPCRPGGFGRMTLRDLKRASARHAAIDLMTPD